MLLDLLRLKSFKFYLDDLIKKVIMIFANCAINYKNSILAIKDFETSFFVILTSKVFNS